MTTTDSELLQQFARDRSEKAFATLVSRHIDLVYSAALRQVRSPQLAEDVAQTVFIDLSRNAEKLAPDTILTAWLYRVTRRAAIDVVRSESRRQLREQIAVELATMNSPDTHWTKIEPLLDEAMDTLDEADRSSILLRYFENKSLREVGQTLGTSDDAAQKRVSRAVERLREFFTKRGVTVGASGLTVVISANAVQAAPIGFALTISSALAGTTLVSTTTATAIKTIAMTTLQKSLITTLVVAAVGVGIYEARQASNLRREIQELRKQQMALADQNPQLIRERDDAMHQLASLREDNERLNRNTSELLALRNKSSLAQTYSHELAALKATLNEQTNQTPDYLTNLMTASSFKLKKRAEDRLDRMKKVMNLSDDQTQAINEVMQNDIQSYSKMALDVITRKLTPEQRKSRLEEIGDEEAKIKALLTPEQLARYPEYKQVEKSTRADRIAKHDARTLAEDFHLSIEQEGKLRALYYDLHFNGLDAEGTAETKKNTNLADAAEKVVEIQKQQLENKLKILGPFLTPEQIAQYRRNELDRIHSNAKAMKLFLPE